MKSLNFVHALSTVVVDSLDLDYCTVLCTYSQESGTVFTVLYSLYCTVSYQYLYQGIRDQGIKILFYHYLITGGTPPPRSNVSKKAS